MRRISKFAIVLLILSYFTACGNDPASSTGQTADKAANEQLSQAQADSIAASKPSAAATTAYGPNNEVIGTWEPIENGQYRIFCGGNKFESIERPNGPRGYMLNDFAEVYTLSNKPDGSGFLLVETATDRILWDVTIAADKITFNHEQMPYPAYIDLTNSQQPKAVYANQAMSTLLFKNNQHLISIPQGHIVINGQAYSPAYMIFGLGIAIAPPHQIILLQELLERGV